MKKWLSSLFGQKQSAYPCVWDINKTSVYQHLLPWQEQLSPLPESLSELPDAPNADDNQIRWANGAEDGVLGHHGVGNSETDVHQLYSLLKTAVEKGDKPSVTQFYQYALQNTPICYIDELIELIVKRQDLPATKLAEFTDWLLHNSPDKNIVKLAIAFSVFFPSHERLNTLYCLAAHDEFTLYAIFPIHAMIESPEEYEAMWLKMAKRVEGWGRVQLIERLPEQLSKETQQWILSDGYMNQVMIEYTAWQCATYCHLADELDSLSNIKLLTAATHILQALINGGPARDIHDYEDAPRCCLTYLRQIEKQGYSLEYYFAVQGILEFFQENNDGYEESADIISLAQQILDNPTWDSLISDGLNSDDNSIFRQATYVATSRKQDVFSYLYEKQCAHPESNLWYELMQTDDVENVKQVVALAEEQFTLAEIATGPRDDLGIGPNYQPHGQLDLILQELHRFPGTGFSLIQCALQSPVVRNRNMALNALFSWERATWPTHLEAFLINCYDVEPNKEIKQRFDSLLKGLPVDNN
ncbi:hypothetical protein [Providencia rettgeri]|uniref:hypothetical protein n=1 Tax=Providencia rettgeri TaxID=587 RepID=UPI0034E07809